MKKRILCLLAVLALVLGCLAACGDGTTSTPGKDDPSPNKVNKPQLVVAMNPVLVYGDNSSVVAYNDINGAMRADNEASSLSAMYQTTAWQWAYQKDGAWTQRATYGMGRWVNGAGAEAKKTVAYSFNADGDISLSRYTANNLKLSAYNGVTAPEVGVLLSATGSEQEALVYTAQKDGVLAIPAGSITAIAEVAGVKTGFLAEDGTARSAALTISLNGKQLWSGTLCNSTAAADGIAVTSVSYPQLDDLKVTAGAKLLFTLKLDAQANKDEDISKPSYDEDDYWSISSRTEMVPVTKPTADKSDYVEGAGSVPIIIDYASAFKLVRDPENRSYINLVAKMASDMTDALQTEVTVAYPDDEPGEFEIIVGRHPKYPESLAIYDELKNYRADCAMDYIIRLVGTRVYIAGVTDTGLSRAVDYFLQKFGLKDEAVIPGGYNYISRAPHNAYMLGGQNIGSYSAIRVEKYPTYMAMQAAEDIQNLIQEKAGYEIGIVKGTAGMDTAAMEIRIGPMNDSVKVDRIYNTAFTYQNDAQYSSIRSDGLMDNVGDSYYEIGFVGNHLVANGGSTYAVNAGVQVMLQLLDEKREIPAGYKLTGDYNSQYAYWLNANTDKDGYDTRYDTVKYELSDNFGLVFSEEFDMKSSHIETEKDLRSRWTISGDGTSPSGSGSDFNVGQKRPGVYGHNWWVQQDATGNGYLLEITKYQSGSMANWDLTYEAVRLIGQEKWGYRYGTLEVRMVMGTRNGACSSVWASGGNPLPDRGGAHNEVDIYENYGRDRFYPNVHTWDESVNKEGHINHIANGDMRNTSKSPAAGEHFYDTFHTIGYEWTSSEMNFYFDGEIYNTVDITPTIMGAFRHGNTIKLANGIGVGGYSRNYDPVDFLPGGKQALDSDPDNGLDAIENFFEVQYVDFVRVFQTNPKGQSSKDASTFYTDRRFAQVK